MKPSNTRTASIPTVLEHSPVHMSDSRPNTPIKAVVMAGGEGSRLRPLTIGRPKPMVPIANKSVMEHILDLLKSHHMFEVIVTLRYMAAAIQDAFNDGGNLGMQLTYSVEEIPLGTAGSVRHAAELLDETFVVISGDALTDFDLTELVRRHKACGAMASITLTRVPNPLEYGVIVTDNSLENGGRITQFLEKPSWSELISDTVNTGIYILEPEILELIPEETEYDFGSQLFPKMLEAGLPLYGHIAEGYWCDVGNINEYMRANADALYGRVMLSKPIGTHIGGDIWVGENVEIAPNAQLFGPIYLGNGVQIKGDVIVSGPTVIRDYTVVDNYNRIERSIIWRNNYIGESCELRGCILSRQSSIKSHASIFEGVVVGEKSVLGSGAVLHPDVKLWPNKEIEPGATVKESVIWGNQGRRSLFNRFGISGVVNVDLTPEFAAKLGAALGASLPKNSFVAVNRDAHRISRMIKRALISGLPSTGINVWDTEQIAIPVLRHFVRNSEDTSAGIHVRLSPFDQRVLDIRFMDKNGLNQSSTAERSIERAFFREDFRRAYLDEIGAIDYAHNPIPRYRRDFLNHVDVERIRQSNFKVVVDYSHGLAGSVLADILTHLNVDVVPLNALPNEGKLAMLQDEFRGNMHQMAQIVQVLGADLGVQLDVGGEKIFIVDNQGHMLDDMTAALLMAELSLFANPDNPIAVTIATPNAFNIVANWHHAFLHRIRTNMHSMMLAANSLNPLIIMDGSGNFIFPDFQPAVDGMMAIVRLLEYMTIREMPLSDVLTYLPHSHIAHISINCPWEQKGMIMRLLFESYNGTNIERVDGLKIHVNEQEWVHIRPVAEAPLFHVVAEGINERRANALAEEYSSQIQSWMAL